MFVMNMKSTLMKKVIIPFQFRLFYQINLRDPAASKKQFSDIYLL